MIRTPQLFANSCEDLSQRAVSARPKGPDRSTKAINLALGMTNMSKKKTDDITIALSPLQVEQVLRAAGQQRNGTVSNLLIAALDNAYRPTDGDRRGTQLQKATREALEEALGDPQLSQSLLRGLAILASYGPERPWRAIIDLAQQLGMSPSTTHRYVKTLRAVGLLEQNPTTREYRPVAV
jgi:DNA-binding MarR family transcriptional regulator